MKALGVILLVLGLGGVGLGVYGMMEISAADATIAENTEHLEKMFPNAKGDIDFTSIEDLVAIDRFLKNEPLAEHPDAAWDILNAMGDRQDAENMQLYGFAGGGGLAFVGVSFLVLGIRKKPAEA